MVTELKKCPFCGGEAKLDMNRNNKSGAWFVFAKCQDCYATAHSVYLGPLETRQDFEDSQEIFDEVADRAARQWNRRSK